MLKAHGLRPWETRQLSLPFMTWLDPVANVADEVAALAANERARQEAR